MEKSKTCNRPWRYSLAMFGLSIAGYMYVTYGTFFYTETIGLSMKLIALGNVLYAVWDAFNDPIAGYLSDRTRTRWGRRKPWLLVSVPVFVLSSILFFSPPASLGTGVGLAVYFTVFLMLTETGNTISTVNYHSLLPELYRDEKRRNQANALRQAMQLVGMIIGVSLVPMITAAIGYRATALALGLLSGALILYSILGCRERSEFSQSEQPGLLASLKALATNANFWLVSVSHFFYQSTSGLLLAFRSTSSTRCSYRTATPHFSPRPCSSAPSPRCTSGTALSTGWARLNAGASRWRGWDFRWCRCTLCTACCPHALPAYWWVWASRA